VGIVAMGQVLLQVFKFPSVHIIPPVFRIRACVTSGMDNGPVRGCTSIDIVSSLNSRQKWWRILNNDLYILIIV
jgi:hypothetical protein